jgi:hypothetical protein
VRRLTFFLAAVLLVLVAEKAPCHEITFSIDPNNRNSLGFNEMRVEEAAPLSIRRGRFLSVDPAWESADLGKPQSWNRYSYVLSNPINMTDPDGRIALVPIIMGVLWVADKAYAAYEAHQDYKAIQSGQTTVSNVAQRRALETRLGMAAGPIGRLGGKAVAKVIIKNADEATSLSSRAARREATRQAGIPTSQQPTGQSSPRGPGNLPAGRQLEYDTPAGKKVVQHQLQDQNHGPHREAGQPKPGGQTDPAGRPRLQNDKVKVDEMDPP